MSLATKMTTRNPVVHASPIPGELLCFNVRSHRDPGVQYRVELDAYNYNGACSCEHFTIRLEPELAKQGRHAKPSPLLRCKHIMEARDSFMDEVLPKLGQAINKQPEVKKQVDYYLKNH